jgi:galactonate dehydratase
VRLSYANGRIGTGEASLNGLEDAVVAAGARFAPHVLAASPGDPGAFSSAIRTADLQLPEAAMVSAVDQALWDLHATDAGASLADLLGGVHHTSIPVYANINRRTRTRTPAGFAQSARDAIAAGFSALKIAPFDEVEPGAGLSAMQAGLARIEAVRAAAGASCRLMVDCHWRFDEAQARALLDAVAAFHLYWVECPIAETLASIPALLRLRGRANALGMLLAGLEQGIAFEAFQPYCEAGAYDVMMPDVKYVGGLAEMMRCCGELSRHGVQVSLHNPSGPVSHCASLHVAAAMDAFDMLEMQFDESPLFRDLASTAIPACTEGHSALPAGCGLGVQLDLAQLAAHADRPGRTWSEA